jgi:hypothetical protein
VAAVFWFAEGARSLKESRQFYSLSSIEKDIPVVEEFENFAEQP